MKLKLLDYLRADEPIVIASFGGAQIVRHRDGRYELRGGTPDDHTAAREWAWSRLPQLYSRLRMIMLGQRGKL